MHPSTGAFVTSVCNQPRALSSLVCLSGGAPACPSVRWLFGHVADAVAAGSLRALPFAGEARSEKGAPSHPFHPTPKNQTNAPTPPHAYGSFLAFRRPRGACPRRSAANEKEEICVKIESMAAMSGERGAPRRPYVS